jgi:hypothetical protein
MKSSLPAVPEKVVLREALAALRDLGIPASRRNVGAVRSLHKGQERLIRFGTPGEADISATLLDGRRCEIEVKRKGKRPTPKQYAYLRAVLASNGVAFWIDDAAVLWRIVPKLLAGCRIEIDEAGDCFVTDEPKDMR